MPLEEISSNVRRYGGQSPMSTYDTSKGQRLQTKPDVVSNMLKTTTETGNVGSLSTYPSRPPRSTSYLPRQSRSQYLKSAAATGVRTNPQGPRPKDGPRLPRPVPTFPALSRQSTVQSSLSSYYNNPRLRTRPLPSAPYGWDQPTAPAGANRDRKPSSYDSFQDRSASPAVSDAQPGPGYGRRPRLFRVSSRATGVSTPSSDFDLDHHESYRGWNKSTSSLRRFSSSPMLGSLPRRIISPVLSRDATSGSMHHQAARYGTSSAASYGTVQRPATHSRIPMYYDYTEAFAEECSQSLDRDVPFSHVEMSRARLDQELPSSTRQAEPMSTTAQGPSITSHGVPTQHGHSHIEERLQNPLDSCGCVTMRSTEDSRTTNNFDDLKDYEDCTQKFESSQDSTPSRTSQLVSTSIPAGDRVSRIPEGLAQRGTLGVRKSSGLSYRTCSASPSTFFPNVNRSSRDLTSLAARVHDATPHDASVNDSRPTREGQGKTDDLLPNVSTDPRSQLSPPDLRALSGSHGFDNRVEEATSSDIPAWLNKAESSCSPPEMCALYHSGQDFSKVLELDDQERTSVDNSGMQHIISHGASRGSPWTEPYRGDRSNVRSADPDQWSGSQNSKGESLLDKHIECLGRRQQPRVSDVQGLGILCDASARSPEVDLDKDGNTSRSASEPSMDSGIQSSDIGLAQISSLASPDGQDLIPRSLFSSERVRTRGLNASEPTPCMSIPSPHTSPGRVSAERNRLFPPSNSSSPGSPLSQDVQNNSPPRPEMSNYEAQVQQAPELSLSPCLVSRSRGNAEAVLDWKQDEDDKGWEEGYGDAASIQQHALRHAFAGRTYQRRRVRTRTQRQRRSQSQGDSRAGELSLTADSDHVGRTLSQDRRSIQHLLPEQRHQVMEDDEVHRGQVISNTPRLQGSEIVLPASTLQIENRQAESIQNLVHTVHCKDDTSQTPSLPTIVSHYSDASAIESFRNARLGAFVPYLGTPDLGPPLNLVGFNRGSPLPPAGTAAAPNLRSMQSFFSDDSCPSQHSGASMRRRFRFPRFRGRLGPSQSAQPVMSDKGNFVGNSHNRLHHSWRMRGSRQEETRDCVSGTAVPSGSAGCRRMREKIKSWWQKTGTIQKKVSRKGGAGERDPA